MSYKKKSDKGKSYIGFSIVCGLVNDKRKSNNIQNN